jgi:Ca2+-binding EF-hand superfamily protein
MDADTCVTECAVQTDLQTHSLDEGVNHFVTDESYNEDSSGGDEMREAYNEDAPEEVPECAPEPGYEAGEKPAFTTLDTNGDGVIDPDEAFAFTEKACIPNEIGEQIFMEADLNQDKVISQEEFDAHGGEETKNEVAMDDALEEKFEGDDETNTVQNPPLEEFDKDNSGDLDNEEATDMFEHEIERRTEHQDGTDKVVEELKPEIDEAINEVDTNGDGNISGDEYVAESTEDAGMDDELQEAAAADEDKDEPEDLSRAGGPAPAPAAFISHRRQLRRGHGSRTQARKQVAHLRKGLHAKQSHREHTQHRKGLQTKKAQRKLKYGQAMLAAAQRQQRIRKASFAQHQRRLHRAMLAHKQAMRHSSNGHRALRHHRK